MKNDFECDLKNMSRSLTCELLKVLPLRQNPCWVHYILTSTYLKLSFLQYLESDSCHPKKIGHPRSFPKALSL